MSLNEPQASQENNLEELKAKLNDFIAQNSITQFECEDIVELVEEGEGIDWIIDQLKGNSPDMNADEIRLDSYRIWRQRPLFTTSGARF